MEAQKPLEQETPETTPQEAPTATIPQPESTPAANMEADPIPEEMDAPQESPAKKTAGKLAALIGGGIVDKTSFAMPRPILRKREASGRVFVDGVVTGEIHGTVSGVMRANVDGDVKLNLISGSMSQPPTPRIPEKGVSQNEEN